jgi:hypothetical protein
MIIGICGLIGSGKDTIASHLVDKHGYERYSWASPLKDITATLFGWDRDMLEGTTPEQRAKREEIDPWWDRKLDKYDLVSPRWVLQFIGTEVMRNTLHTDIWVLAGMKRIEGKKNVVIPDTRFPNEIKAIREMGGIIWNVQRGPLPEWYPKLVELRKDPNFSPSLIEWFMHENYPRVHASEYSWVGTEFDAVFHNNETVNRLQQSVDSIIGD